MIEANFTLEGDCLERMAELPDKSIDLILTDLPYGVTACHWDSVIPLEPLWAHYKRLIKERGAIVLTASQPFTTDLINSNRSWFKYELIWHKIQTGAPGVARIRPLPCHENILVFGKRPTYNPQLENGKPYTDKRNTLRKKIGVQGEGAFNRKPIKNTGTRYPQSIQVFSNHNYKSLHPTQKPVALFEYLIRTYTNEGDTVLDSCAGSGTTAIACINSNRKYIVIEREAKYIEIIKKRIADTSRPLIFTEDPG